MILVSLNIIYLVFCYIQIKSLFMRNTTLNYAHYARQGFFQLMVVSIINLVTILIAKKRENKNESKTNKFINYMSLIMIIFTFIIVISAGVRMYFYENAYGYTLLRILVYFALITETILIMPTFVFICNDKFSPWKTYFVVITVMYLVMNFSNINQIIAKQNVDRYLQNPKSEIDVMYLMKTNTDGIEELIKLYKQIENPILKQRLERYFVSLKIQLEQEKDNLLEWNYSRWKARNLLQNIEIPENLEYNSCNDIAKP